MKEVEYNRRNIKRSSELVNESTINPPRNQREKDLFALKYMLYGIGYGSLLYRIGSVSALQRAIKRLEENAE